MPVDFDRREYWRSRFATETSFEWLASSEAFAAILAPQLGRLDASSRILHLGSGTSDLHNRLRARGFLRVTNVDYEPLAAERGAQLERAAFGDVRMAYVVADATDLALGERFDLAVDKSTADAVACAGDAALLAMARCVRGCLAEGGCWVSMSYSSSRFDVAGLPFDVEVAARLPTPKARPTDPDVYHYCYLLTPQSGRLP